MELDRTDVAWSVPFSWRICARVTWAQRASRARASFCGWALDARLSVRGGRGQLLVFSTMLAAVWLASGALRYASTELQNDLEVLAAVKQ